MRRIDAEVLTDILHLIYGGKRESYSSAIPEPFTFIPEEHRAITLADASITSSFLEMFGRPSRDTGLLLERNNQPTDSQALHMLNSTHIQTMIERGPRLRIMTKAAGRNRPLFIEMLYLNTLSRFPTVAETKAATAYFNQKGISPRSAAHDLAWALTNSREFLFHH